ncbi:hypothetical protein ACHAXT_006697 [Thalassiosira profunda]
MRMHLQSVAAASAGAVAATLLLWLLAGPAFLLFAPRQLWQKAALQLLTLVALHRWILRPLRKESRPGSRYARRWIECVSLLLLQIICALVVHGPLRILFLGHDPLDFVRRLRRAIRAMDAKILRVRPPLFDVDEWGQNITIPLGDRVETAATLYSPLLPNGDVDRSPRPVVLIRTPYSRESLQRWGIRLAERGYHFVAQDTRGRFGSTGDFFPMLNEAKDGASTIRWIEQQEWCNGRVGMTGMSYLGLCAWAAMREEVPALKAVAPIMAATDLYNVMFGRDAGAAHVELLFRWSHLVMHLMVKPLGMVESMFTFFLGTGKSLQKAYRHAPYKEVDTKYLVPDSDTLTWFHDGFDHPLGNEPFWEDKRHFVRFEEMESIPPVLLFCGWYDFFNVEMMHDYRAVRKLNPDCRMVVGPYTHWHIASMDPKLWRSLLDFFDRQLLQDATARELPAVNAFAMGEEMRWMELENWPPPNGRTTTYRFAKGLAVEEGEHLLVDEDEGTNNPEDEVSYVYDPADPTPQIGGATFNPSNCGRLDQSTIEQRDDVLTFTTPPLESPVLIAGEIRVHLEVESNVEGTDYVARACHVITDGRSANIADGIVRRFDLTPGKRFSVEIVLAPVLNRLDAGDCLRVQICSSAYPKYGRHLNTRGSFHLEVEDNALISEQILFVGGDKGCRVVVPTL